MVTTTAETSRRAGGRSGRSVLALVGWTRTAQLPASCALLAARIALAWIFVYYGAGKLFGAFNGPGIHRTAIYFSETAHLHPGGFYAPCWEGWVRVRGRPGAGTQCPLTPHQGSHSSGTW